MAGYFAPKPIWTDYRQLGTNSETAIPQPYSAPYDFGGNAFASKFTRNVIYGGNPSNNLDDDLLILEVEAAIGRVRCSQTGMHARVGIHINHSKGTGNGIMTSGNFTASSDNDGGAINFRVRGVYPVEWQVTTINQAPPPLPIPLAVPVPNTTMMRVPLFADLDDEITISLRAGWVLDRHRPNTKYSLAKPLKPAIVLS